MPDDTTGTATSQTAATTLIIPTELRQTFPDIVDLVMQSESMNNDERQYWFDILPVMSPEQIQQLRDILVNEKNQLAAIDAKYGEEIKKVHTDTTEQTDEERRRKHQELLSKEMAARTEETNAAEDILKQME